MLFSRLVFHGLPPLDLWLVLREETILAAGTYMLKLQHRNRKKIGRLIDYHYWC